MNIISILKKDMEKTLIMTNNEASAFTYTNFISLYKEKRVKIKQKSIKWTKIRKN